MCNNNFKNYSRSDCCCNQNIFYSKNKKIEYLKNTLKCMRAKEKDLEEYIKGLKAE